MRSSPRARLSRQLLLPILAHLSLVAQTATAALSWTEDSFEDFRDGEFLDAGSNLYVSAHGRIQMINRWDLNGDGLLDVVMPTGHAQTEKENIIIYLNQEGEIGGRAKIELPGNNTRDGFIADINQDGFNDLVVVNYSDSQSYQMAVWIYFGTTDGLSAENRVALPGYRGTSIAKGDFNGDGWIDVAVSCQYFPGPDQAPRSLVYWNSKDGFRPENRTELLLENDVAKMAAAGEFDQDGTDDLILTGDTGTYLFLSSKNALENPEGRVRLADGGTAVTAGDYDGDGLADIAIGAPGAVTVHLGLGHGKFDRKVLSFAVEQPVDIELLDINRDGRGDIVVANYASSGGATWTDSYVFVSTRNNASSREPIRLPTLGAVGVSVGDLNEDGFPELVFSNQHVTNERSLLSYVYWNDKGTFRFGHHTQLATRGAHRNAIGDIDHDSRPDVVFFNDEGGFRDGASQTHIYLGDGTRHFSPERRTTFPSHHVFGYAHADLDDDGHVDFLWCESRFIATVDHLQTGLVFYWGTESGFTGPTNLAMENAYGGVRIADINKDGYLDLLVGGVIMDLDHPEQHGFPIFWGSDLGFQHLNRTVIPYEVSAMRAPLLMDLNKDGWLDIAGQLDLGTATIWWGAREGYDNDRTTILELEHDARLMYLKAADFNRDGWLDLFLPQRPFDHSEEAPSHLYYGSAEGFQTGESVEIPTFSAYQNTIADFDRDGWLDLFVTSYAGEVTGNPPALLYYGSETGLLTRPRTELPSNGSSGSQAGDFDGDGWLDLLVVNHRQAGSIMEPIPYRHETEAMLFWGAEDGFSPDRMSPLPNKGPSGLNQRDLGNSYDRGLYEDYVSSLHPVPADTRPKRITWAGETPHGTEIHFQIRMADDENQLDSNQWQGPDGNDSWFLENSSPLPELKGHWVQYRARLVSPNGAASPYLNSVTIDFE